MAKYTTREIFEMVQAGLMGIEDAQKHMALMEVRKVKLSAYCGQGGQEGSRIISLGGLRQFPVTLFRSEIEVLLSDEFKEQYSEFIKEYGEYIPLSKKDSKKPVPRELISLEKGDDRPFKVAKERVEA